MLRALLIATAIGLIGMTSAGAGDYPERPVKVILPAKAGGGTGTFVQFMQPFIEKHLGKPLVIVPVPGAGTVTGSRRAKDADADGYTVLINHLSLHAPYAMGKSDFSYKDFELVAGTTATPEILITGGDTPYKTYQDFVAAAKAKPNEIIAGVNIGATNHLAVALAAKQSDDIKLRYVQTGGSVATITAILGGHAAIGAITVADAKPYVASGDIRILMVMDDARNANLSDVPTAKELGIDAKLLLDYYWYMPKGTPKEAIETFATALEKAFQEPDLIAGLKERWIPPSYSRGAAAQASVDASFGAIMDAAKAAGLAK